MDERLEHPMAEERTHTRREFIRKVLIKTAYTAPVIATFSVANVAHANGDSPRMMTKRLKMSKPKGTGTLW